MADTARLIPVVLAASVALLIGTSGCGGGYIRPSPTRAGPDHSGEWFCQPAADGGWECVQDEALVKRPNPTRSPDPVAEQPGAPLPEPEEAPFGPSPGAEPELDAVAPPANVPPEARAADADRTESPEDSSAARIADDAVERVEPMEREATTAQREPPGQELQTAETFDSAARPLDALPPDYFVVQLVAMPSRDELDRFIEEHAMEGLPSARVESNGSILHVLLLGVYPTYESAVAASADLSANLNGVEPWVRSVASLQESMRAADRIAGTSSP